MLRGLVYRLSGGALLLAFLAPLNANAYSCIAYPMHPHDCDADIYNCRYNRCHSLEDKAQWSALRAGEIKSEGGTAISHTATGSGEIGSGGSVWGIHSPVAPAAPLSAFEGIADVDKNGERISMEKAGDAYKKSSDASYIAKYERGLADAIASNYDSIQNFLKPRQNSADAGQRSEAASRLLERPAPSPDYADIYPKLGIRTNQDLVNKAPQLTQNLAEDSRLFERDAEILKKDADDGMKAAQALDSFHKTVNQRVTSMKSIDSQTILSADESGTPEAPHSPKGFKGGRSDNSSSLITGETAKDLKTGEKTESVPKKLNGASSIVQAGPGGEATVENKAPGNSVESLRDKLKRSLASAKGVKDGAASEENSASSTAESKQSSYAGFFEDSSPGTEGRKVSDSNDSGARHPFMLSGPETEKQIERFMGRFQGDSSQQGGMEIYGSVDVSIFQRMNKVLIRAQADKKVR